jgi:hypothetical protein
VSATLENIKGDVILPNKESQVQEAILPKELTFLLKENILVQNYIIV